MPHALEHRHDRATVCGSSSTTTTAATRMASSRLRHHLLSPSVIREIRCVIGSQTASYDPTRSTDATADESVEAARTVTALCGLRCIANPRRVEHGVDGPGQHHAERRRADAIVAEAMRTDTDVPLWIACGGGLTNLASALLIEPAIAGRLTALWIGGQEHPGLAEPERGPSRRRVQHEHRRPRRTGGVRRFHPADVAGALRRVPAGAGRSEMLHRMRPCGPLPHPSLRGTSGQHRRDERVRPQHG